jgi:hypothetical protein
MSLVYCRRLKISSKRLHIVGRIAADLTAQLAELNELRNRVRWAEQSARRSWPTNLRIRTRI